MRTGHPGHKPTGTIIRQAGTLPRLAGRQAGRQAGRHIFYSYYSFYTVLVMQLGGVLLAVLILPWFEECRGSLQGVMGILAGVVAVKYIDHGCSAH